MSRITGAFDYSAVVQRAAERAGKTAKVAAQGPESTAAFEVAPTRKAGAADGIGKAVRAVSELQQDADRVVMDLASGRDVNIPGAMIELEKADIALRYTVQLRNRALQAYEELMRIQV